jgi:flagellar hook-associated protein 3 FlgL
MRIGTANTYDQALEQLLRRQTELSSQQEKLTSGQKVNRASDDPTGAAQAERALVRMSRIEVDQRSLELQRNALSSAESTLGDASAVLMSARDLVVAAGNASYSPADRSTLAKQMTGLRDQLFALANRTDNNGVALFGGLGGPSAPFADIPAGVQFQASAGQRSATEIAVPGAMDGQAIWMNVANGNGAFKPTLGAGNTGSLWTDVGTVVTPAIPSVPIDNYTVSFTVAAGATTFTVVDTTTSTTVLSGQPYVDGGAIQFAGLSLVAHGQPQNGDAFSLAPSTQTNVFKVLDDAIASLDNAPTGNKVAQAVALSLAQFDSSLERLRAARGQAGDWLNRADSITDAQGARTISLEADKSRAIDLDMVKGYSDFSKLNTGYQAALQSYAQIQKLSLFNFIN